MKQISRKIIFVLSLSMLFSSFSLGAFANDKDFPIIYSVVKPQPVVVNTLPPVEAE